MIDPTNKVEPSHQCPGAAPASEIKPATPHWPKAGQAAGAPAGVGAGPKTSDIRAALVELLKQLEVTPAGSPDLAQIRSRIQAVQQAQDARAELMVVLIRDIERERLEKCDADMDKIAAGVRKLLERPDLTMWEGRQLLKLVDRLRADSLKVFFDHYQRRKKQQSKNWPH